MENCIFLKFPLSFVLTEALVKSKLYYKVIK